MTDSVLSRVIEGRLISAAPEIVPGGTDLRAVDVVGRFAAVFRFAVGKRGDYWTDCVIAMRTSPGAWQETTGGGSHGDCDVPFRPSRQLLGGRSVSIWGSAGMELPEDNADDAMILVRGLYRFVTPEVRGIRVRSNGEERNVAVESPAGAFVVVILGSGFAELQGLDDSGKVTGPSESYRPSV